MKYKLIATDLDGTLGNSKYLVDEENALAAQKMVSAGGYVVLCSGRSVASLKYVAENELGLKDVYLIGFNGGVTVHSTDMIAIHEEKLKKDYALEAHEFLRKYKVDETGKPQTIVGIYTDFYEILTEQKHLLEKLYIKQNNKMHLNEQEHIKRLEDDVYKMLILGENHTLKMLEPLLLELANDRYDVVFTGFNLLEIVPKNINKGNALTNLAEHLKIPIEQTIGIGDNYNDIELIKQAGLGIAVKNAVDELKEIADIVTENDNDNYAFAEAVEYALGNM
ncbi:MAG: Cof-type HAD-IIB family hydrolase [Defluviitaleaceae bacterium]|nr:Cof-type HAD-IIB family hydrolase [Defluviitaleaceae bacterium]